MIVSDVPFLMHTFAAEKKRLYYWERYVWKTFFFPLMTWNANICNNSNMIINRQIINLKRLIDYEMQVR